MAMAIVSDILSGSVSEDIGSDLGGSEVEDDVAFREKIEPLLLERNLKKSDLQVYLKVEDVETVSGFIGKDWYSFGKAMDVDTSTLDGIKEDNLKKGLSKRDMKGDLLRYLIRNDKVRYERIIYGHYNLCSDSPFIITILDYLAKERLTISQQKPVLERKAFVKKPKKDRESRPWQAFYEKRAAAPPKHHSSKQVLNAQNYQKQFYSKLFFEEAEHMGKLERKCNGDYYLFLFTYSGETDIPPELKEDAIEGTSRLYGYIKGDDFTDDKIEYATQTSEGAHIYDSNHSYVCKAFIPSYNHVHLEQCLYVTLPYGAKGKFDTSPIHNSGYEVNVEFEVSHDYFNNLHHSVVNLPSYVKNSLLPTAKSFSKLEVKFCPQWSEYNFMKLDKDKQTAALQMITSTSTHSDITSCPPPVILYGPFGSGKTRILARAAYEIMTNGLARGTLTRILICAHHPRSTNAFIDDYFLEIERLTKKKLPFRVIHVSRYLGNPYGSTSNFPYRHFYMTIDELKNAAIKDNESLIIVASYTASLGLYDILNVPDYGFFTHLFLDEAAQVREPEAITPLAMATRDAKIVLAGDDKQVGPRTLVLGDEAKSSGLDISLLERLMNSYEQLGSIADTYVTRLTMNYRSHESLLVLPELFYGPIATSDIKPYWQHHTGPAGYYFVCSDSRLVPEGIDPDQPLVEACIVLEQVLLYLREVEKDEEKVRRTRNRICVISSTRKQLNHIKKMASQYSRYQNFKQRGVSFLPSFMIQGHEFQAIFLSLLQPLKTGDIKNYFIKSLFNPYVFNTVVTRAKTLVVAVGKPQELLDFENANMTESDVKCWHKYLQLCEERKTLQNLDQPRIKSDVLIKLGIQQKSSVPENEWPSLIQLGAIEGDVDPESGQMKVITHGVGRIKNDSNETAKLDVENMIVLQKENTLLQEKNTALQERNTTLREEKTALQEKNTALQKTITILQEEKSDLQEENKGLKGELDKHKKISQETHRQLTRQSSTVSRSASIKTPSDIDIHYLEWPAVDSDNENVVEDLNKVAKVLMPRKKQKRKTKSESKITFEAQKHHETITSPTTYEAKQTSDEIHVSQILQPAVVKEKPLSKLNNFCLYMFFLLLIIFCALDHLNYKEVIVPLPSVEVLATKRLTVVGGQASLLHWDEFGLRLDIPSNALPPRTVAKVLIRVSVLGPYVYPDSEIWKPASAVYWITSSKEFITPVLLGIWHNVRLSTNSSLIRVITAEDIPRNMTYKFRYITDEFTVNGSYIYLSLNHFSGYTVLSPEENFQGALLYRKSQTNIWDYSFIIYNSFANGVNDRLLSKSDYEGWRYELNDFDVIFEDDSKSIKLDFDIDPHLENWTIRGKIFPLMYKRNRIKGNIKSNMQFILRWKGTGYPTSADSEDFTLTFTGAEQPKRIAFTSRSVDEIGGNIVKGTSGGIVPHNELQQLLSYAEEVSAPKEFCIHLGFGETECKIIEKDEHGVKHQKITIIGKWLQKENPTWKEYATALAKMGNCRKAKELSRKHDVYFYEKDKGLKDCPTINDEE